MNQCSLFGDEEVQASIPGLVYQPEFLGRDEEQALIEAFFDWLETLACGIDLFDQRAYQQSNAVIDPVSRLTRAPLRAVNG